jgi:hypothetical protein
VRDFCKAPKHVKNVENKGGNNGGVAREGRQC